MQASSRDIVVRLCDQAVLYKDLIQPPTEVVHKIAEQLSASDDEANKVEIKLNSIQLFLVSHIHIQWNSLRLASLKILKITKI